MQYLPKANNHFFQALIMNINANDLNAPADEFNNLYDIEYELNQRDNEEMKMM